MRNTWALINQRIRQISNDTPQQQNSSNWGGEFVQDSPLADQLQEKLAMILSQRLTACLKKPQDITSKEV